MLRYVQGLKVGAVLLFSILSSTIRLLCMYFLINKKERCLAGGSEQEKKAAAGELNHSSKTCSGSALREDVPVDGSPFHLLKQYSTTIMKRGHITRMLIGE